jgi:AraC-like DNA-binding protein
MPGLDRSSLTTDDPEVARRAFGPMVPRLSFGRVDPAALRVRLGFDVAPSFTIIEYAFAAPAATVAGSDDLVVISAKGRGFELWHGRTMVDPRLPYLQAAEGLSAKWDTVAARATMLDRSRVAEVARSATGDAGARLEDVGLAPVSAALGRSWEVAVHRVRGALWSAPEAFAEPIVEQAAFHRLAMAYLAAFRPDWVDAAGRRAPVGARSRVVRVALEFLRAHAAESITVQHVADAVHITTRGLHAAFVAELGSPPSDVLRGIRLEGARDELRFSEPGVAVSTVARRWGFVHLSRFAETYGRTFGEKPSETLRR